MFGLFKRSEREKQLAKSIRALKTVRVSDRGAISIDVAEILQDRSFIEASKKAKQIVAANG